MRDIREQLGLGWMKSRRLEQQSIERGEVPSEATDSFLEEAVIAFGQPLLRWLLAQPNRTGQLFDLLDERDAPLEELLPVVRHFEQRGYLEMVQEDRRGNHTLRLTEDGADLAQRGA